VRKNPTGGANLVQQAGVPRHFTLAAKVTTGAAIVGVGAGIALGLTARSKYDACQQPPFCSASQKNTIRYFDFAADASWVVGLGAAVATAVLYATSGEKAHVVVAPTEGGVALSLGGRW
jgi:hypothetical protein